MTSTPEEDLARKKNVRAAHRASATRLMNQADSLIGASPLNTDELTLLQTSLSAKLKTLETLNAEIVDLTPEAQLEEEIGRADEYSEKIQRMLLQVQKALQPSVPTVVAPPPRAPSSATVSTPPTAPSGSAVAGGKVKLPKISLPHFKGNPIYWTAFLGLV